MAICENPDVLKVIYFFLLIIDIVKIIIPIALIVFGLIDFSKAVISSDEKEQNKSGKLFLKRLLYAVLVFVIPWLIKVLMVTLGNLLGDQNTTNFTDCIENANSDEIARLEALQEQEKSCYFCSAGDRYKWGYEPNDVCISANGWVKLDDILIESDCVSDNSNNTDNFGNGGAGSCYVCSADPLRKTYQWSLIKPTTGCPGDWKEDTTVSKSNCK